MKLTAWTSQAKRPAAPDSQDIAPPSRPKRARRSCYRSRRVYDLLESDSEDLQSPVRFLTSVFHVSGYLSHACSRMLLFTDPLDIL
jgi:hypothetical protein